MELKTVKIRENGEGVPLRHSIKFNTGTLLPGETLGIPVSQAVRAERQGIVDIIEMNAAPAPVAKPKPKKKAPKPTGPVVVDRSRFDEDPLS